uniref:Uncharacterized protein n=1 Tax=Onchocerca volvulus TaxID=6282 RepID=A0A8R1XYH9_ONCVO
MSITGDFLRKGQMKHLHFKTFVKEKTEALRFRRSINLDHWILFAIRGPLLLLTKSSLMGDENISESSSATNGEIKSLPGYDKAVSIFRA